MRLICFWCFLVAVGAQGDFYVPQTFKQHVATGALFAPATPWESQTQMRYTKIEGYQKGLFSPAGRNDIVPQSTVVESWRPKGEASYESWPGQSNNAPAPSLPKPEPWRMPYAITKEQQAAIIHHKQALSSEGSFQFEYASDNGLAAGEVIQPDGSRIGSYQYKDPSGQLVKLKYKAGKEGFQILEGSHLPKSPEPVPPMNQEQHYTHAYEQQREQYALQQQYNQQKPDPQSWRPNQQQQDGQSQKSSGPYYTQNWRPQDQEDDGQYRENDLYNKGPHNFGEGYAFAFKG